MNNDTKATKVDGGDDEVQTCEVNFVPRDDDDFGVFSGGEESYYSDVEPVPVVLEEEVQIEDEGDVVVLNDDEGVEKLEDEDGEEEDGETFLWNQRMTVERFWRTQLDTYEDKILKLEKGFRTAKREAEEEREEVERLRRLYMNKVSEAERLRETVADLVSQNCELETKDQVRKRNNKRRVQELRKDLDSERRRNQALEEELSATRKRLLTFTRRSVPRKARRLIRRIDSYEDGTESTVSLERTTSDEDNEDTRVNKLIRIMDNF